MFSGNIIDEEDIPVESDRPRSTPDLSHIGEVVLIAMLELTYSFLENGIAVMEFFQTLDVPAWTP